MTDPAAATHMPAVFFGHGNPMNAIEHNGYTEAWHAFGTSIPRPRAILCISAHWYVNATAVTAMGTPRTIHDFGGFPRALYEVRYPAAGDPELAAEVQRLLAPLEVPADLSWGLDHGTWSVLVHAYPDADVPVVQLAIDATKPFEDHLALGRALAPLRDRGVLIVGSGNVVHNLRAIDWAHPDSGADWAERFETDSRALLTSAPAEVLTLQDHPDFGRAAPTPDHFIPILYLAGLAHVARQPLDVLVAGLSMGSLSMTSYTLGA